MVEVAFELGAKDTLSDLGRHPNPEADFEAFSAVPKAQLALDVVCRRSGRMLFKRRDSCGTCSFPQPKTESRLGPR